LWGKARSYLDASIGITPRVDSYRELAELLELLGEDEAAMACYRDGLRLATGGDGDVEELPRLPERPEAEGRSAETGLPAVAQ